jgi:hypothetical protein
LKAGEVAALLKTAAMTDTNIGGGDNYGGGEGGD